MFRPRTMKMAAGVDRIVMGCWLGRTALKCRWGHSCKSEFKNGIGYVSSKGNRSFCSTNGHFKRQFIKTVWPIIGFKSYYRTCSFRFSNLEPKSNKINHPSFGQNIKELVPRIVVRREYSFPAHDAITNYETVLKHGNFIFYWKKDTNEDYDFDKFKSSFLEDFVLKEDFISCEEENLLLCDVEKALKRLKYEYDHWDGVIHGYRELEKSRWGPENRKVIQRIKDEAFDNETTMLPGVHVLDLFKDGYIKPHVDSKFCGRRIAGASLLSTAIMRLKPKESENYTLFVDVLLKQRSLYIMRDYTRYELTHEVLPDEISYFGSEKVVRDRRIAVVMREEPTT